ncbi:MAG: hypothetical protein B6U95_00515 [Thermofilum sp. ex4484_82]|nr:hypothetical protein [Thermoproteales archaeon]OYT30400.1 MAG: hypothetical protein B6U95_00515 [Thermofilum sp. ex4484_82]OYT40030.1 MAG: hypothetical protein B6U96_00520 [Archaeoglobales archaeon ex4484_92]RLE76210.1 MAG: hypothetical protein DRZ80_01435 [Thermoprotei archaeon]RLE77857.1 MAG: hypothetical protein DRJ44_01050 [Thermoprotei archaeon]
MNIKSIVEKLKNREDDLGRLKLDIMRVLTIFNGVLWESEIISDIVKVHNYVMDYVPSEDSLKKALKELKKEGVITIEERERGSTFSSETYKDRLIKLSNLRDAKIALMSDSVYRNYMARKMEMIRRALEERY